MGLWSGIRDSKQDIEEEVLGIYRVRNAVWFFNHQGDPKAPHVELTTGLCSDGYVDSGKVTCDPKIAEYLARMLAVCVRQHPSVPSNIQWVVSSAYAAITFGYELARQLGAQHAFTEKDPIVPRRMTWSGRFTIPTYATALQGEELITTFYTVSTVREAVRAGNEYPVAFLPFVATVFHRPPSPPDPTGPSVIALVTKVIQTWQRTDCPLCQQGSPRYRPRSHWRELTGK